MIADGKAGIATSVLENKNLDLISSMILGTGKKK